MKNPDRTASAEHLARIREKLRATLERKPGAYKMSPYKTRAGVSADQDSFDEMQKRYTARAFRLDMELKSNE